MPSTISISDLGGVQKALPLQPQKEGLELDYRSLIGPGIKHVLASKLNNLTGKKLKCLRNWEESSGEALLNTIKKVYGQKLIKNTVDGVNEVTQLVIKNVQKWVGENSTITDLTGIDQSVKTCRKFVEVFCSLLTQGDIGTTQNIDRLLTIIGGAYSGNEDVKDIVDKVLESYSKDFFENMLPDIIKDSCGVFAGPVEKFVGILGIKDVVDDFLRQRILQDQSVEKVLRGKDVYEKLVLNGVSTFVELKDAESLSLEGLLNDEKISNGLREQLLELQSLLANSKLSQFVLLVEKSSMSKLLVYLKDKDIIHMTKNDLKKVLSDMGGEYVYEGISAVSKAVGTVFGTIYRKSADVVSVVTGKAPEVLENALDAGAKGVGFVIGKVLVAGKMVVETLGEGIVRVAEKFDKSSGKAEAKPQDEAPIVTKSTEASADAIPGVGPVITATEREVSVREPDTPTIVKDAKTEVAETTPEDPEVGQLVDDFGEYLQVLFSEEPKAETLKTDDPKTVVTQNPEPATSPLEKTEPTPEPKPVEQREVEQEEGESTSVMSAVGNVALESAKLVGKGVLKTAEVTGKVVVVATPVVTKVAVETVKVSGKVALKTAQIGGEALVGVARLGWFGIKALWNLATGPSAEPEPEKSASEGDSKPETKVSKDIPSESQTARVSKDDGASKATTAKSEN